MSEGYVEERDGGFYIRGARVSLDSIVHAFRRGESPETIRSNFELIQLEQVYGAITFYLANQTLVNTYLARQEAKWAEGKRTSEPLPIELRDRLKRVRQETHTNPVSCKRASLPTRILTSPL